MKFQDNYNNVDITEFIENRNSVKISFWNGSTNSFGTVEFDEKKLRELRKWITVQIRKMKPVSKPSKK